MEILLQNKLEQKYKLIKKDMGELDHLDKKGMHFKFNAFDIEGIGNVSVFNMHGMLGLMKMSSVVVNPFYKDAPMFSFDNIIVMGKQITIIEIYNTCLDKIDTSSLEEIKDKYFDLKDGSSEPSWSNYLKMKGTLRKISKKKNKRVNLLINEFFDGYLNLLDNSKEVDYKTKKEKADKYTLDLIENGGPAVNQIKSFIGKEKTTKLFREFIFGTK